MMNFLSEKMETLKVERRKAYKGPQSTKNNTENKGGYQRPNNFTPPNVQKERGRDREDQRIQAPFQNNFMAKEEEGETDELDLEIHCFRENPPFHHLTQEYYEESLMDSQLNELSKGDKASGD
jgi:hypothetical protein